MRIMVVFSALMLMASAAADTFKKGPLITEFGPHAEVNHQIVLNADTRFQVAFDVAEQGETGKINTRFESLARFLNMHVANGVDAKNIDLALIVHGKAAWDLTQNSAYEAKFGAQNANLPLLEALQAHGVRITVCGQSTIHYEITNQMLAEGVKMSLSAMTEHAILQQRGFTLNPF